MYCTLDDILNVLSEKDLINLTNDIQLKRKPPSDDDRASCDDSQNRVDDCTKPNCFGLVPTPPQFAKVPQYIDEDRFEAISRDADSLINGYLRARYKLPLKSVPTFIKTVATDICAYRLYSRRPQKIPEHIVTNYNNSLSALKDIQKGNLLLEATGEDDNIDIPALKSGFRCSKNSRDRIFTDRMMKLYRGF